MNESLFLAMVFAGLRLSTPLAFAAIGGYFNERSGTVNIALEGMMLIGAFTSAVFAHASGNPWIGVSAGILGAVLFACLHSVLCIQMKSDQIISGIAINLLAAGIPPVVCKALYDSSGGTPMLPITARFDSFLGVSPFLVLLVILIPILVLVHNHSRFGQYLRFAGEHPFALETQGVSVRKIRWQAMILSGIFCGLAGSYLAIDHGSGFTRNMTAGRGFIALAALIIGRWNPLGAVLAALIFGLIETSQILLQGVQLSNGVTVPVQWIQMIPYIATLIILSGFFGKKLGKLQVPKALGQPFLGLLLVLILSGCRPVELVKEKIFGSKEVMVHKEEKKEDEALPPTDIRIINAEFIKELYKDVLGREATPEESIRLMNVLDQGGHYEGLYNGMVYSEEYRAREKRRAAAPALKLYAELMAKLVLMQKYDPITTDAQEKVKPDVPKPESTKTPVVKGPSEAEIAGLQGEIERESIGLSGYSMKRKLGEEVLRTIDLKKEYKEKLANWYSKFTIILNSKGVDFGFMQRNSKDEYYHYKWALDQDEDRIKWECLNRIHVLLNEKI